MTLIVFLMLGVCLAGGLILVRRNRSGGRALPGVRCPHCEMRNPRRAEYCGHCGKALS